MSRGQAGRTGDDMTRRVLFAAYGAWIAVCFFWGTTYLAIRVGLETLPPLLFAGMRFMAAGLLLFVFVFFVQRARLPKGKEWLHQMLIGLMLLGIGNGMVVIAEQWVPSGPAALLVATSPFWVVGLERLLKNGERSTKRTLIGLLLGFLGLIVLMAPNLTGLNVNTLYLVGAVAIQLACASWAAGSVFSKHHQTNLSPFMAAAVQMLIAGVAMTLVGTTIGEWHSLHFSTRSFYALIYLIVFGSIVAFGSYTYAIQKLPLSIVSTYSYINPVIAVLLGWLILSETLSVRVIVAMAIILGSVALVKTSPESRMVKRLADPISDEPCQQL